MAKRVPASIEAEQALLGSMLLYPDTIKLAYEENVQVSDFFTEAHKTIYQVILQLTEEKKPVDTTSVITRLTDIQELNNVGGVDYIVQLTDLVVSSTNCEYYIENIQEKSLLRSLIQTTEQIQNKIYQDQADALDILNEAESMIKQVSSQRKTTDFIAGKESFDKAIKNIISLEKNSNMSGVPSGYKYLDNMTNGFQKGDLIILAARPSIGKTALALNMAVNATVSEKKVVAMFSLEMDDLQLANRMLAIKSTVDLQKIRTGQNLDNDDWARINAAKNRLAPADIYLNDSSMVRVNDVFAKCRKLQSEKGLDLVIIDYLQLITPSGKKSDNRQQDVSEISRSLKSMARELRVPVIALSQLSRAIEVNTKERDPQLSDLRESGAIEQDADIVIFLHQPKKAEKKDQPDDDNEPNKDIKLIVAKHRNGSTGTLFLAFNKATTAFYTKEFRAEEQNYE